MAMLELPLEPHNPLLAQSFYVWVNMQCPSSSNTLGSSNSSQGILAGPSNPTAAESPSGSSRRRLAFTRTPLPPPGRHGRKSVKDRPPTPGGPALSEHLSQLKRSASTSSTSKHSITISRRRSLVTPSVSSHKSQDPGVSKKILVAQPRPRFPSLSVPTANSPPSVPSIPARVSHMMQDEGLRFLQPSSTSWSSTAANSSHAASHLSRSRSTTAVPTRVSPHPTRIEIPDGRPGSSGSSNLPDSPGTRALMDRLLAAPDYYDFGNPDDPNDEDDGSEASSIRFASMNSGHGRIGAISPSPDRRQRANEKLSRLLGTTSDDEFARSRTGSRIVGDGGGSLGEDRHGRRKHGYEPHHQSLSMKAKGKQRMSDVPEDVDSDEEMKRAGKGVGRAGEGVTQRPKTHLEVRGGGHRHSSSGAYSHSQQANAAARSSRHYPQPPSPASSGTQTIPPRLHALDALLPRHNTSPGPPRSHALDALAPNRGVKRSQSASAVAPGSQNHPHHPVRSPATSSFSIPTSQHNRTVASYRVSPAAPKGNSLPPSPDLPWKGPSSKPLPEVETPFVAARSSSRAVDTATEGKKAKRRRSALVWMKEQANSIIPSSSKSVPSIADDILSRSQSSSIHATRSNTGQHGNSSVQHGFSKSEGGSGLRQTLGTHPRRSGSSSPNSPAQQLPPTHPYRKATADPRRGSLEVARNRRADDSMGVGLGSPRSNRTVPAGSDQPNEEIFLNSTVTHKAEKSSSSFSFGLSRSLSSKKILSTKEDKRQRNRLRGKATNEKLKEPHQNIATDRKSRDEAHPFVDRPQNRRSYSLSHVVQAPFDENGLPWLDATEGAADRAGYSTPPRQRVDTNELGTGGSGGRFWKLVKRIGSSGALRDKYEETSVPPVPTLPPHVARSPATSPVSEGSGANDATDYLDDSESSPASPSKSLSPSKPTPGSSSRLKYSAAAPLSEGSNNHLQQPRSLPQTRSSTPASVDQMKFRAAQYHNPSGHSSTSSLVDPKPQASPPHPPLTFSAYRPMPSPSDRGHLSDGGYQSKTHGTQKRRHGTEGDSPFVSEDSWTPVDSPALEFPSLPAPPRRHITQVPPPAVVESISEGLFSPAMSGGFDGLDVTEDLSSIPEFSVENVINTFLPRRGSTATRPSNQDPPTEALPLPPAINVVKADALTPPPRPARNARRPPPSTTDTEDSPPPRTFTKAPTSEGSDSRSRARPITRSFGPNPLLKSTSSSLPRTPDSEISQLSPADTISSADWRSLTEKEKAAKWDALLEKSERAGGTLHLTIRGDRERLYSP
ncbi:hypothetical protein BKA70DRAFT_1270603 [Coprinopsis sp. MPI-PUGE-AT-0042]|nr:hypothetical protein BKA70DRAFT_1270603 [Coprinopsis sp. MPI-PUGE-AT-0042]